jgi:hypothetical protein
MEKEYTFEVTLKIDLDISATSEAEARKQLTEQVREYFAQTTIEISEAEAKLVNTD